ncbi:hypothetical protein LOTGIDRAFT_228445 [Lottia gigantea]|uniref:Acyl-CoA dehydrogenase/oxidase C-terminal domain-containing protein n=1 Tax=Lottia gigantea TaxID=225164 RepID=V4AWN0_LOTGI|nr:hypothetical protein LOTGIDRAFT_228445 [Lottia gigantea]ESO97931.1 hypothetical protein LOTGIDRAFT_228445 [Lottia gigantea]
MLRLRPVPLSVIRRISKSNKSTTSSAHPEIQELEDGRIVHTGMPFAHAKIGNFFQEKPELGNQFVEDSLLQSYLKRNIPQELYSKIQKDLKKFGQRVVTDIYSLHLQCDRELPQLEQCDAWGNRVDKLITSHAWKQMHDISAEEGLIAIAYERKFKEWSRLYQMAKNYLFSPSAGLYSCPLAMTDGASSIIEAIGDKNDWLKQRAWLRLTNRDPKQFWTSGQWMTERKGGSDVARGTETLAQLQPDGSYTLHGYKWFSSATDADMAFTLARPLDKDGLSFNGTSGLSLFYLEIRDESGNLNNIQIQKLKNKLGTKQVPTAELLLDGTRAFKVSDDGRGVASISNMLTITRMHNAMSAASGMRRIVNMARDYTTRRTAFGNVLKDYPLHIQTLARMEVETRAATLFFLEMSRLLGKEDSETISNEEKQLFRLMTPVLKLYTGKQAVAVTSEGLECFGGQGYIEDTGLPGMLRDAQVLTIWEGTTNILSLDVLRALNKSKGQALKSYYDVIDSKLNSINNETLEVSVDRVQQAAGSILKFASQNTDNVEMAARDFSYSLARTYMGALMLEQANQVDSTPQDVYAANRWCEQDLCPVIKHKSKDIYSKQIADSNFQLVFDGYSRPSRL